MIVYHLHQDKEFFINDRIKKGIVFQNGFAFQTVFKFSWRTIPLEHTSNTK